MNRKTLPALLVAAALPLAACASGTADERPQYQGVCMSQDGHNRVDDDYCDPDDDDYAGPGWAMWAFLALNSRAPAVGSSLTGTRYVTSRPSKPYVLGGVPVRGGVITASTMAAGTSPYGSSRPASSPKPSVKPSAKPSTSPSAKSSDSATQSPTAKASAPATPQASKKPWWKAASGACNKMSRSSGGSKSYSSGGGSKSWGSSGSKSTSKDTPKSSSGSSSSKKSC